MAEAVVVVVETWMRKMKTMMIRIMTDNKTEDRVKKVAKIEEATKKHSCSTKMDL